jgi:hypothetical protein
VRAGWNPTRRNRNIGTKAHGHGSNNKLVIPETSLKRDLRCFYEKFSSYAVVRRRVAGRDLVFLVEPTRLGWFYPCTIEDVCHAFAHLPPEHVATFDMVVMRQPTRKQRILSPVWGRAIWVFDSPSLSGPAIVLEAQIDEPLSWPVSLSPERTRELDRLRADGHEVRRTKRRFEIATTAETLRNTVLYRTLLHEVGHHVDYSRRSAEEWYGLTSTEKEDFAHRYAAEARERLRDLGVVPFTKLLDVDDSSGSGLRPEWFEPAGGSV